MKKTKAALTTQKNEIKNETVAAANSAVRVGTMIEDFIDSVNLLPEAKSGTAIAFTENAIYGTRSAPITGNLTADETNAVAGTYATILHNHTTVPTFATAFKKLSNSQEYLTGRINRIDCQYIEAGIIHYSISQEPV